MAQASPCFSYEAEEYTAERLKKLQALPLEDKILYSTVKIKQFYTAMNGKVYVSFSGGKDSTVLLHLVRSIYPDTPAVFCDTGLEFPEIRDQVMHTENVVILKPEMSFKKVIETRGYPVISKEIAHWTDLAKRGCPSGIKQMSLDGRFGGKRYQYLIDAPFRISRDCCDILKKRPAHRYNKESGRHPYIGTHADESRLRATKWLSGGENNMEAKEPTSSPLSIWRDEDIWSYIEKYSLPYAKVYDMGYDRTGCIFCMFGITRDRDRFTRLKATHPQLWVYCMRPREEGGLGIREVLDYINIPTGCEQTNLIEFIEKEADR